MVYLPKHAFTLIGCAGRRLISEEGGTLVITEDGLPLVAAQCEVDRWGDSVGGLLGFICLHSQTTTRHTDRHTYTKPGLSFHPRPGWHTLANSHTRTNTQT